MGNWKEGEPHFEIRRFGPSDLWLIGANESSPLEGSIATSTGFVSKRRVALPLADPHKQNIHAFRFENDVATVLLAPGLSGEVMESVREGDTSEVSSSWHW